jgi:hypothetical protein
VALKNRKNFNISIYLIRDIVLISGAKFMNLKFMRKLTKSTGNKAAQITIPRCVAQAWSEYDAMELVYEGNELKIVPIKTNNHI